MEKKQLKNLEDDKKNKEEDLEVDEEEIKDLKSEKKIESNGLDTQNDKIKLKVGDANVGSNYDKIEEPIMMLISDSIKATTKSISESIQKKFRRGVFVLGEEDYSLNNLKVEDGYYKLIERVIPKLYEFDVTSATSQKVDTSPFKISEDVRANRRTEEAYNLVSSTTVTLRYSQSDNFGTISIPKVDDMSVSEGLVHISKVKDARDNTSTRVNYILAGILNTAAAFKAFNNILLAAPGKEMLMRSRAEDVLQEMTDMKPADCDNPHVYWATFVHDVDWFRRELLQTIEEAPARFGELPLSVTSGLRGLKISAEWAVTTDQFSAKILSINFNKFRDMQTALPGYIAMLQACTPRNLLINVDAPPEAVFPMIRTPTQEATNASWLYLMINRNIKYNLIEFLTTQVESTNRLQLGDITQVFNLGENTTDEVLTDYKNAISEYFGVGEQGNLSRMIVLETFSDWIDPSYQPLPVGKAAGNLVNILGILSWWVMFPRITQKMQHELGYELMIAIRHYVGHSVFATFIRANGWYKRRNELGNWEILDTRGEKRYTRDTPDNIRCSLFTPIVRPNGRQPPETVQLFQLLQQVSDFCDYEFQQVGLQNKENAVHFPYYDNQFMGTRSWEYMAAQDIDIRDETRITRKINELAQILSALYRYVDATNKLRRTTGTNNWWQSFMGTLDLASKSAPLFVNHTCADIQEWLMNSPFYVYDGVRLDDPNAGPKRIGLGAEPVEGRNQDMAAPIYIDPLEYKFDIMIAARVLLSGSGDYERFIDFAVNNDSNSGANSRRTERRDIVRPDPIVMLNKWFEVVRNGEALAVPLRFSYWLTHPDADDNPIGDVVAELPRFMVRQWGTVVSKMFEVLGATSVESFMRIFERNGVRDIRYFETRVCYISKDPMGTELPDYPNNSLLGVRLDVVDQYSEEIISLLARLYTDIDSPFTKMVQGMVIGRLNVVERRLSQIRLAQIFPREFAIADIEFVNRTVKDSNMRGIILNNEPDVITSPFSERLRGVRIVMDYPSQIPLNFIGWMTAAVLYGHISLVFRQKRIVYSVIDRPSRLLAYNEDMVRTSIENILRSEDGELMYHQFETTCYANNFVINAEAVPEYIQWIALLEEPENNLLTSSIATTVDPPENHVRLDPEQWGYGTYDAQNEDGLMPITGVPKLQARKLNFNNKVPVVLKPAFEQKPEITMVPQSSYRFGE